MEQRASSFAIYPLADRLAGTGCADKLAGDGHYCAIFTVAIEARIEGTKIASDALSGAGNS